MREAHSYFDGLERLKRSEYHGALGAWLRRSFTYDALGQRIQETLPYSTLAQGYTARSYDALGRVRTVRSFDASGVATGSVALDYAGRLNSRVYDVGGRLRRVTDPSPGGTTRYDYDSFGNLNRIQSASGAVSSGVHDVRTRKMGDMIVVDAHLEVDAAISVEAGHDIAVAARQRVLQRHRVLILMTHVDPWRRPDLDHAGVTTPTGH